MSGRGVFINTVPKAGKNVLYSFLNNLGFSRFDLAADVPRDQAMLASYSPHFAELNRRATWALPACGEAARGKWGESIAQSIPILLAKLHDMPNLSYLSHHFAFHPQLYSGLGKEGIPMVFLYRDPRDILFSMANYFLTQRKPEHLAPVLDGLTLDEIMLRFLEGNETLVAFSDYLSSFNGWLEAEGVFSLKFEEIIGPLGRGNAETQFEKLQLLADYCGWQGSKEELDAAIFSSFSTVTGTFYRGQIGAWRQVCHARIKAKMNRATRRLLDAWKYEIDPRGKEISVSEIQSYAISALRILEKNHLSAIDTQRKNCESLKQTLKSSEEDSKKRLGQIKELQQRLEAKNSEHADHASRTALEKGSLEQLLRSRAEEIGQLKEAYRINQEDSGKRLEKIKELNKQLEMEKAASGENAARFAREKGDLEQLLEERTDEANRLKEDVGQIRIERDIQLEWGKKLQVDLGEKERELAAIKSSPVRSAAAILMSKFIALLKRRKMSDPR